MKLTRKMKKNRIQHYLNSKFKKTKVLLAALLFAVSSHAAMEDFISVPPLLSNTDNPLVMFVMSNDNQMWHKAYTDYTDLDNDGVLDTSYNDNFVYYGYFNSEYCYSYSSGLYTPAGKVTLPMSATSTSTPTPNHSCSSATGKWSGNFMNWLTMTRMDVIRKVLYGGYRSTDTTSGTVLQRALLPSDNHAFVKVVKNESITGSISDYTPITGLDADGEAVSFCNVTDADDTSGGSLSGDLSLSSNPPLLKVAVGDHFTWSGSEQYQCQYTDEGGNSLYSPARPAASDISGISQVEFNVRINTCVAGEDEGDCREYSSASNTYYKPAGLLQSYGENGGLQFGLMTGSYNKNDAGGVLRKNVSYMGGDESSSADREIDTDTGQFINQTSSDDGIINTLNRVRIQGWDYSTNLYDDCNTWGISVSDFLTSSDSTKRCRDWGNPLAEMYVEALRYFSGQTAASTDFAADDSSVDAALGPVSWADPMTESNACANCAVILLSTGLNTFDHDNLSSVSDLPDLSGVSSIDDYTDRIGVAEGISGNDYLIGNASSGGTVDTCDTKTINDFSDANGICPELPSVGGGYQLSGLSYYGYINDLRSLTGEQNVDTYAVSLSENLPHLEIETTSGESVTIVPYCQAQHTSGSAGFGGFGGWGGWGGGGASTTYWLDCSLVDLTVKKLTDNYGLFYIAWEDSLWGSDYDMDAYAVIEYCTATGTAAAVETACGNFTSDEASGATRPSWNSASTGQIQLRVAVVGEAMGVDMRFGYVMNGSTTDGTYDDLSVSSTNTNFNSPALTGSDASTTLWASTANKFTAQAGTPGALENPLWYAAKYGNFKDSNNNDIPDIESEWDRKDVEGNLGADGLPDAYFPVRNPAYLESSLSRILADITTRVSSGTAASVVASTGAGEGVVYQALYNPLFEVESSSGNPEVTWVGTLHALFIDKNSELREDLETGSEAVGQLTANDPIVEIFYDEGLERTMVQRYLVNSDGTRGAASGSPFEITDLQPIWSARDQLALVSNYTSNRVYSDLANTGRYIFTGIDTPTDRDNVISANEAIAFEADTFSTSGSTHFRLLDYGSSDTDITNLVNFIRGDETISGFRSRTIEWDGDSSNGEEPWLLGDIVNSSPVALTRPNKGYDVSHGDNTYSAFKKAVESRRQVVMLGANDGMIHAFNAGFYDAATTSYATTVSSESAHPLGSELWAYVPYNLLPHLQYLAEPDYAHVYYVDGQPQIFDVNGIWSSDTAIEHPEGWGNILVAGMRFGGGELTLDPDSAPDGNADDDITLRSGYVILDVTDPESPPEIIAEISDADLGYSVSVPTLVKFRSKNSGSGGYSSPAKNEWFLVFGSGPAGSTSSARSAALQSAVSDKSAKIYAYNLGTRTLQSFDTGVSNAFVGGVEAGDWNNDFQDDAIYFGVVGGTESAPTGQLMRGVLTLSGTALSMSFSKVIDVTDKPFSAPPSVVRDRSNNFWVYSGTGRYYTSGDNGSTTDQSFYGVKDPDADMKGVSGTEVSTSTLVETTDIDVFNDGSIKRSGTTPVTLNTGESAETFSDVMSVVADHSGWYFDLPYSRERNTTKATLSDESLVFTTYQTTGEVCNAEGNGYLYAPHYQVGIPGEFAPLGTDSTVLNGTAEMVERNLSLGTGNPSTPTIYQDSQGRSRAIVQTSTGEIVNQEITGRTRTGQRQSWREIPIDW